MKSYELDSRDIKIELNKTAGRFYFEKFNASSNRELYRELFNGSSDIKIAREVFKKFVCIINLETNAYCNRTCSYCPISLIDRKDRDKKMSDFIFNKIFDELESIAYSSSISLNLYNEPLSDDSIFNKIRFIKQKCKDSFLRFNSNGDFLTKEMLEELESSGLDSINITLHTTKEDSYNDAQSIKKLDRFYSRLNLAKPQYTISPNVAINSSYKFKNLLLLINTANYDVYGTDRGGCE